MNTVQARKIPSEQALARYERICVGMFMLCMAAVLITLIVFFGGNHWREWVTYWIVGTGLSITGILFNSLAGRLARYRNKHYREVISGTVSNDNKSVAVTGGAHKLLVEVTGCNRVGGMTSQDIPVSPLRLRNVRCGMPFPWRTPMKDEAP